MTRHHEPRREQRPAAQPFGWLTVGPDAPVVLNASGGRTTSALIPRPEGAILWWQFRCDDDRVSVLVCGLTDGEAQKVYDADWRVGMLEPVRSSIVTPEALVVSYGGARPKGRPAIVPVRIPRNTSEERFVARLDRVAARASRLTRWFSFFAFIQGLGLPSRARTEKINMILSGQALSAA